MDICVSLVLEPGSSKVDINWKIDLLLLAFRPSTNYLSFTGALTPRLIIILKACDNIDNNYNAVEYL